MLDSWITLLMMIWFQVETETCISSATEITQEEWESIQSMLFEPDRTELAQDSTLNSSICSPVIGIPDCEPVMLSADYASPSFVTPVSDIQTVTVRSLDCSGRKATNSLGINYQAVGVGHVMNSKVKIQPKPVTTVQSPGILLLEFFLFLVHSSSSNTKNSDVIGMWVRHNCWVINLGPLLVSHKNSI
jgi:hypothetical protein